MHHYTHFYVIIECPSDERSAKSVNARNGHYHCCCRGDLCNANFMWVPKNETEQVEEASEPSPVLAIAAPILCVVAVLGAAIFVYKYKKKKSGGPAHIHFMNGRVGNSLDGGGDHLEILPLNPQDEIDLQQPAIARGKFGEVWKGLKTCSGEPVAVKIFKHEAKPSWVIEQDVYKLPRMDHANVLKYLGVQTRNQSDMLQYWLITDFHERGSLSDFLRNNVVSWEDTCRIAKGMQLSQYRSLRNFPDTKLPRVKIS